MHPRVAQLPHRVGPPFVARHKASWGNAKWPSTKTCFAFDRGEACNAATCRYTHTRVDAVVAPTQRHSAIVNKPNPILPDRQHCGPFVDCQFATSRFQEIACLPQSLPTHLEISLSATIMILFRIFSLAYQHNNIKGSPI